MSCTLAWGGVDTVHILAGVTCIKPLHQLAGSTLVPAPASVQSTPGVAVKRVFKPSKGDQEVSGLPTKEALDYIAKEARYLSEINYVGTTLSLAVFVSAIQVDVRLNLTRDRSPCWRRLPKHRSSTTSHLWEPKSLLQPDSCTARPKVPP